MTFKITLHNNIFTLNFNKFSFNLISKIKFNYKQYIYQGTCYTFSDNNI